MSPLKCYSGGLDHWAMGWVQAKCPRCGRLACYLETKTELLYGPDATPFARIDEYVKNIERVGAMQAALWRGQPVPPRRDVPTVTHGAPLASRSNQNVRPTCRCGWKGRPTSGSGVARRRIQGKPLLS
jgi:hypothetical protein